MVIFSINMVAQHKTIHVFVALCDNENQGIVPVPKILGNGQDPKSNLYWGAMYGVKSFLRYKSNDWEYVQSLGQVDSIVLERILFKHKTENVYLVADAYDGAYIRKCTEDFLVSSNEQMGDQIKYSGLSLGIYGNANLVAYVGHDGLMDFQVDLDYRDVKSTKDAIMLACASKSYFSAEMKDANANPVLWTTNLMAPEAYTLEAAIGGWIKNETGEEIRERAAQAYHKYQKCGINGARNLFATGF